MVGNAVAQEILGVGSYPMVGQASTASRWRAIHPGGGTFSREGYPVAVVPTTGNSIIEVMIGVGQQSETAMWISDAMASDSGQFGLRGFQAGTPTGSSRCMSTCDIRQFPDDRSAY